MGYTCIKAQKQKFLFLVLQFQFRKVANFSRKSKGIQWPTKDEMMVSSYCVQLRTYRFILLWNSSSEFVIEATSTLLWTQFYYKLNQILTTNFAYFLVCQHNVHLFHEAKFHIDPMLHKQAMPNLKHLQLVMGVFKTMYPTLLSCTERQSTLASHNGFSKFVCIQPPPVSCFRTANSPFLRFVCVSGPFSQDAMYTGCCGFSTVDGTWGIGTRGSLPLSYARDVQSPMSSWFVCLNRLGPSSSWKQLCVLHILSCIICDPESLVVEWTEQTADCPQ